MFVSRFMLYVTGFCKLGFSSLMGRHFVTGYAPSCLFYAKTNI